MNSLTLNFNKNGLFDTIQNNFQRFMFIEMQVKSEYHSLAILALSLSHFNR